MPLRSQNKILPNYDDIFDVSITRESVKHLSSMFGQTTTGVHTLNTKVA